MRARAGFTVTEILIAATLSLVVSTIMYLLYVQFGAAARLGQSRFALQQRSREIVRRVMPILRSGVAPNPAHEAIYLPDITVTAGNVVFSSPSPLLNSAAPSFDPRNPNLNLYQLRYDAPSKNLMLEDIYNPVPTEVIGRDVTAANFTRTFRQGVRFEVLLRGTAQTANGDTKTIDYSTNCSAEIAE